MEQQFKHLRFDSKDELNDWLIKNTFKIIELEDMGQDMQRMWVHKTGEILHCDFHASIYNGQFINMDKLIVGEPLYITNSKNAQSVYNGLIVSKLSSSDYKL